MRDAFEPLKTASRHQPTSGLQGESVLWFLLLVLAGMPVYAHDAGVSSSEISVRRCQRHPREAQVDVAAAAVGIVAR